MNASRTVSILMVAMVTTLLFAPNIKMAGACMGCQDYFDKLQNRTEGSCRCIYYEVYSKDHPQVIADCNNLRQVPDFQAICNMTHVYTVNLQNNRIQRINQNAFRALQISDAVLEWAGANPELILLQNEIDFIHIEAFKGGMEAKLSLLDLRYNKLTLIPDAIFTLVNLTKLYLRNNLIESAHGEPRLSKLTVLDLTANKLSHFPETICHFPSLGYLYLDGNPITQDLSTYLPALSQCDQLKELTWPEPEVTCEQSALELYANTSTCKILVVRHGNNHRVMCNSQSSEQLRGVAFEWALLNELAKVCSDISGATLTTATWVPVLLASLLFFIFAKPFSAFGYVSTREITY